MLKDKLTPIGTITIPVYAHHLHDAPNLSKFDFFKFADCITTVTDVEDAKELGTIGGVVSGHYQIVIRGESESDTFLLDCEEIWNSINEVFNSDTAKQIMDKLRAECQERWDKNIEETEKRIAKREREQLEHDLKSLEETEKELQQIIEQEREQLEQIIEQEKTIQDGFRLWKPKNYVK